MKTIRKGVAVLEHLSKAVGTTGVTDLATALDIDKAIVHRILKTLGEVKLVQQDPATKRYSLGIGFLMMGGRFLHLCVQSDLQTVLLRAYESRQGVRVSASVGEQASLHRISSGKVFLAYGPPDLIERVLQQGLAKHQPNTITGARRLRQEVAMVKRRGYATDIEELDQNYSAIAVAVLGPGGGCVAAIAVAMPVGRMPAKPSEVMLADLQAAARAIAQDLPNAP